ncbi:MULTISPECIES: hypothetical protein [Rhizobium/Agrobacterium group]|uniref:Transmembrane protein n=1 Tax=Agrobacterium deltaense Zutra 3/1 TaxID=1183427 RepID=A0A1S7RSY5_9HYPH|nr:MULTISPECIES: hypothetical protein [Rhizobium/Agrobacterium group]MBB4404227.1 ABC-type Fe3+-siderophore transport system permease subunit [Agrobacterium radiobacter]MBB5590379.1 ABC-type Fe3+-siderophore transport system permease subunit [Agrobacterium radiobacter]RVT73852.1 hypothetical protein EM858_18285 [Agrobacterium sp. CNPSo 2736]TGE86693.1 hypothetical protein C9418_21870 [Rhizobium sp. SEMIA 4032]UXT21019.1 hypothetical protein FY140_09940 [Agrobacterium tumefaciens]
MSNSSRDLIIAAALIVGGLMAFFLFLYLTGHDPDETPLGLMEWIIAGALLGPGFGYLLKWRKNRGR